MTDPYPMPTTAALVAIDVPKMRSEVLIETPGRARRQQLTVVNTRTEHDRFVTELQALAMPVIVGLEATGNYHRPLAWRLLAAGFEVRLVSSVAPARPRGAAQRLGQERSQGCAGDLAHVTNRCDPALL